MYILELSQIYHGLTLESQTELSINGLLHFIHLLETKASIQVLNYLFLHVYCLEGIEIFKEQWNKRTGVNAPLVIFPLSFYFSLYHLAQSSVYLFLMTTWGWDSSGQLTEMLSSFLRKGIFFLHSLNPLCCSYVYQNKLRTCWIPAMYSTLEEDN